jgi:hypothetical protein
VPPRALHGTGVVSTTLRRSGLLPPTGLALRIAVLGMALALLVGGEAFVLTLPVA